MFRIYISVQKKSLSYLYDKNDRRIRRRRPNDLSTRMTSSEILRRVALVRTDVSEELNASFIRLTRIGELGTTLAETSNLRTLILIVIYVCIVFKV
jgi:YD repeat-containing protein